jgi:hypothetical protein
VTTQTDDLCDRIARVIREDDEPTAVFNALIDLYVFQMSLLPCPDCRKQAARALKRSIPDMLATANREAAQYAASTGENPAHTCH